MSSHYYLYDPADNLALGQAIHLANGDSGRSYVVPFANKTGKVDAADPASAGLGVIETAIAGGPLVPGQSNDPLSNQLSPAAFQSRVSPEQWQAIKAMVKASVLQSPPADWSEASLEAADTVYTVISSDAYPQLKTNVFTGGDWKDADTSADGGNRGNPKIAFGGNITDEIFVDFAGHFMATPDVIGQATISKDGKNNNGALYKPSTGDLVILRDVGSIAYGLTVNAGAKAVHLANFSATSMGFGGLGYADALGFLPSDPYVLGLALRVASGDVHIGGDFVLDQLVQVVDGTVSRPAVVSIEGSSSKVTFEKARLFLGAMRGYESSLRVDSGGLLKIDDSKIYAFSSSNSDAPAIDGAGLDWQGFINPVPRGSAGPNHMIVAAGGGTAQLNNTVFSLEDRREPAGAYSAIANNMGINGKWANNDYRNIAAGDLHVATGGNLEINGSRVLGSITADPLSASLKLKDSVVAGTPLGSQTGGSLVQVAGGNTSISNSLIDSLDAVLVGGGSLKTSADTHILATNTPWTVSTTTDADYAALPSLAGPSATTVLDTWGDKESGAAARIHFQFQGPEQARIAPSGKQRGIPTALVTSGAPVAESPGAVVFSLAAVFAEAVSGFDQADLQAALGPAAVATGWSVAGTPISRDGGRNWTFQLRSPAVFSGEQSVQLSAGAAASVLVDGLTSTRSNPITLRPLDSGSGGSSGSGQGGGVNGKGRRVVRATTDVDRLRGSAAPDSYLFADVQTVTNPNSDQVDRIIGYQSQDWIRILGFDDVVVGQASSLRRISGSAGTAADLTPEAINLVLGTAFLPQQASVFQVEGRRGSYLAVNREGIGFDSNDMLIRLLDFVPSAQNPLTLA